MKVNLIHITDDSCTHPGALAINSNSKIQFSLSEQDIIEVVNPYLWNADNFASCNDAHSAAINSQSWGNDAIMQ